METRHITQVRIYVLALNTFGSAESSEIVAISPEYDRLVQWYNDQFANENWRDSNGFLHTFKKGSVIENYNPCASLELNDTELFGHGIHDEWVELNSFNQNISKRYNTV